MADLVLNSFADYLFPLLVNNCVLHELRLSSMSFGEPAHQRGTDAVLRRDLIVRLILLGTFTHDLGLLLQGQVLQLPLLHPIGEAVLSVAVL